MPEQERFGDLLSHEGLECPSAALAAILPTPAAKLARSTLRLNCLYHLKTSLRSWWMRIWVPQAGQRGVGLVAGCMAC